MGQFDSSLSKAKELIKFENDRIDKIYSSIERDQWEIKVISVIETIGEEWTNFISACPTDETKLKLEFLTIQSLGFMIRDREKSIKKTAPLAFWNQITQQLQEFTQEKGLFPFGTSLIILEKAALAIEEKILQTEWIIQTPKRWNLKWDMKESLDIKIDFLSREIQEYQKKLDPAIAAFASDQSPIGADPFVWPRDLNSILLLLKISAIRKLQSPCVNLPDIRLTATLLTDPNSCTTALRQQLLTSEKAVEELRKKNSNLQLSIQQARAMAIAGNHLKAMEAIKPIPPQFRIHEQREVLDLVAKINQRLVQIQAVLTKLQEMDLQKLDWSNITEFCEEIRETLYNDQFSGSDYEIEATRLLTLIEGYVKRHRKAIIVRWSSILGATMFFLLIIYFLRPSSQIRISSQLDITTTDSRVTWSLFQDNGDFIQKGKGTSELSIENQPLFLLLRQGNRAALHRILWNGKSYLSVYQNTAFSNPFVSIQALDSTRQNTLDPETYQLKVDRIPIPAELEGLYLPKGIHRFSITQEGQPEFSFPQLIAQRNETVVLSSPWIAIRFEANAEDLFVSINNSSKRLIPYRFFLPIGYHEAIFSDSRGDIRESRRIHVEGETENTSELSVSSGIIKIQVKPVRTGLKLMVNDITHSLTNGQRDLTLSAGEQRIQLFIDGKLSYEENLILSDGEELEKTINLAPAP